MATKKQPQARDKEQRQRKPGSQSSHEGIDGSGHHLRAANDDDFEDAERDSCTVTRHRDDLISDS